MVAVDDDENYRAKPRGISLLRRYGYGCTTGMFVSFAFNATMRNRFVEEERN